MAELVVRRIDFGYFVRPAEETGTDAPRVEPCLGYLISHPAGLLLVDTGMGRHPAIDTHYRPYRRGLDATLARAGVRADDIRFLANCHLHFDHCGGNPALAGRPIFTQRTELETARQTPLYTLPELVDAPGLRYELLDGETEVLPGVLVLPTPGHTAGHQSLVVRHQDGTVVIAGQSHDTAAAYGSDALAWRAKHDHHAQPLPLTPGWIDRLQQLDPARVLFAHDNAVWEPADLPDRPERIALRSIDEGDLDALFEQMRDPESVRMAAFTAEDPDDRAAFDAHMSRVLASPDIAHRAVTLDGRLVGSIAGFPVEDRTEITYWIDRSFWGQGVAGRALALFLEAFPVRPLYARVASDNVGSLTVLRRAGFATIGTEVSYANARKAEIEESILRLG